MGFPTELFTEPADENFYLHHLPRRIRRALFVHLRSCLLHSMYRVGVGEFEQLPDLPLGHFSRLADSQPPHQESH
jgi:hypothetical protein